MTLTDLPSLPKIEIPPLPFEVPLLMHPVIVHFAIAIPVLVLLFELFNLVLKRRSLNIITSILLVTISVVYLALYVTGKTDGSEAFGLLSDDGKVALKAHIHLGTYLVYASILLIVFKVMALLFKKRAFKVIYLIVMILFIGVNLKQGKSGGELVYSYGTNVEALTNASNDIDDLNDEIEELQEEIKASENLKAELESTKKQLASLKEQLTCKEVQNSIDIIMQEGYQTVKKTLNDALIKAGAEIEDTANSMGEKVDEVMADVNISQAINNTVSDITKSIKVLNDDKNITH